jgi:hypothetical protein
MIIPKAKLDKLLWDERVLKSKPEGFFFMLSWYLDVVAPEWEAYVIGEYEAIYPIVAQKKFVFNYTIMPFLTRTFYPIGFNSSQMVELDYYLKRRFSYIQLSGLMLKSFTKKTLRQYQNLDLSNYSLENCSENHRRQYKKASKQGFILVENSNPEILIKLFNKVKGEELNHLNEAHYIILENLMIQARNKGFLKQYSLSSGSVLIGAAAYIVIEDQALYLKGAVEPAFMKDGAMVYLHFQSIKSLGEHIRQLDFGGSNAKGLGDFNRKFGARNIEYLHLTLNKLIWPISWFFKNKFG